MGRREKFTNDQIIDALRQANGIIAAAAVKLATTRATIQRAIRTHSAVRVAYEDARETLLDMTEQELFKQIKAGNITAIIFTLKTIGKHRGYVERQEYTGAGGGPLNISQIEITKPEP